MFSCCNIFFVCHCTLSYLEGIKSDLVCTISENFYWYLYLFHKFNFVTVISDSHLFFLIVMLHYVMVLFKSFLVLLISDFIVKIFDVLHLYLIYIFIYLILSDKLQVLHFCYWSIDMNLGGFFIFFI
jgi:hypothetical protein